MGSKQNHSLLITSGHACTPRIWRARAPLLHSRGSFAALGDHCVCAVCFLAYRRQQMRLATESHPIMLAEPSFNSKAAREKAAELLFEKYQSPGTV